MAPSAPALLSTTSCWPIDCDTECASTRVTMSVEAAFVKEQMESYRRILRAAGVQPE